MPGGISAQAPSWPALYNPAFELDGAEGKDAMQPGGYYLTDANGQHG